MNLIPAHRRAARRQRLRARAWVAGCVSYAVALVVLCLAVRTFSAMPRQVRAGDAEAAESRIHELNRSIARESKALAQLEASLAASRAVADRPNWSTLLAIVASKLDADTVLSRCRIDPIQALHASKEAPGKAASAKPGEKIVSPPRQFQLELGGMSRSQRAVSELVLRLQETGLFEGVELVKTAREPFLTMEAIAFQVRCLLKERPKAKE